MSAEVIWKAHTGGSLQGGLRPPRQAYLLVTSGILFQVSHARQCAQLAQQFGSPTGARQARHFALGVVQIAENERLGRAGLRAGRVELAVLELPLFSLRLDFRRLDAL